MRQNDEIADRAFGRALVISVGGGGPRLGNSGVGRVSSYAGGMVCRLSSVLCDSIVTIG